MKEKTNKVFIAFGSNKGDSVNTLKAALKALAKIGQIEKVSSVYKTKPEGYADQADFYNGALILHTALTPHGLLAKLKEVEVALGRKKTFKNGPRELDLDIIFYNNEVIETETLAVPHKMAHERCFVLAPLYELEAELKHPVINKSVKDMLDKVDSSSCVPLAINLLK